MGTGTWRGRAAGNQSSAAADGNESELGKALYTVDLKDSDSPASLQSRPKRQGSFESIWVLKIYEDFL